MGALRQVYRTFIGMLERLPVRINTAKDYIAEWVEVYKMVRRAPAYGRKLSKDQKEQARALWGWYGFNIPLVWHRKYYGYSDRYDPNFFPEILYTTKLDQIMNLPLYTRALSDKNLISFLYQRAERVCPFIKLPMMVCGCSNGYWSYKNEPSTEVAVLEALRHLKDQYIIKPSIGESSGHGVEKITFSEDDATNRAILSRYSKIFVVQECIQQHETFAELHRESVNTVRIMTYRLNGEIKHCPIIIRIGTGKSHLDNAHAGGMYIAVSDDGYLGEFALCNYKERIYSHPDSGIVFQKYRVAGMEKVIIAAEELHKCLPMIGIVNWDLVVDSDENIEIIEGNLSCGGIWLFQNTWGKGCFGEDTKEIVNILRKRAV